MNNKRLFQKTGNVRFVLSSALLGALTGCVGYVEQPRPREVYVAPPAASAQYVAPPTVEAPYVPSPAVAAPYVAPPVLEASIAIRTENDFYEPLSPYGRWAVVGSHGRCWIPNRVAADWRPYSNGYWQRTDAGWYWASDEPWGWATYHYGRWDLSAELGWYWVPQTVWAPAWVSWHSGGGYVGWAPLNSSVRIAAGGSVDVNVRVIAPRAFVFVEERRFLEPVRPTTVVVNNTTIVNKTVNITNIKVVNNTVINEGPRTQIIEQVSGQRVQSVPVRELRRRQEAEVVARQRLAPAASERTVQTPVRGQVDPGGKSPQVDADRRANESRLKAQEQSQRNARELEQKAAQVESERRANDSRVKTQEQSQKNARELQQKAAQLDTERRANDSRVKAREQSQRNARELERKAAQLDTERRANDSRVKAQEQSQKNARELEQKAAQLDTERRANDSRVKAQEQSQKNIRALDQKAAKLESERRAKDAQKKAQLESKGRGKGKPAAVEKGGTNTVDSVEKEKVKE